MDLGSKPTLKIRGRALVTSPRRAVYIGPPRHNLVTGTVLQFGMTGEIPPPFQPLYFQPDGQERRLLVNASDLSIAITHKRIRE